MPDKKERDLRSYARGTQLRLVIGAVILLIAGDGLIWWLFGWTAASSALLCTGFGLMLALLMAAWMWFLGWFARRAKGD